VRPRNIAQHRKFFVLLTTVWEAGAPWASKDAMLDELKLRIGHVRKVKLERALDWYTEDGTIVQIPAGTIVQIPDSISFASMGQAEFDEFYERALAELCVMAGDIDDGVVREEVLNQLSGQR